MPRGVVVAVHFARIFVTERAWLDLKWPRSFEQISASLSRSSAGVMLPCGAAAGESRLDPGCDRQGLREVALRCRRRCSGRLIAVLLRRHHWHADRLPRT